MYSSLSRFASLSTHSFPCLNRNAADLILHRTSQSSQISTIVWSTARRGRPRSSTSVRDALPSAPASVSAGLRLVPRRLQSSPRQPPCSSLPRALSTSPHAGVVYQHGLTHIPASKNACRRFRVRNQPGHGRGRGCGPYPGFVSERGCIPSVFSERRTRSRDADSAGIRRSGHADDNLQYSLGTEISDFFMRNWGDTVIRFNISPPSLKKKSGRHSATDSLKHRY